MAPAHRVGHVDQAMTLAHLAGKDVAETPRAGSADSTHFATCRELRPSTR